MTGGQVSSRRRRKDEPSKGDRRDKAILDAAEAQLETDTLDTMTVESIARAAGLTRNALYFYYASKHDVLAALVRRTVDQISMDATDAATDTTADPRDVIVHSVKNTERMWRQHWRVMRAAVELGAAIPEIGQLWTDTVKKYISAMEAVLKRAGVDETAAGTPYEIAAALCWMTERNFYHAFAPGSTPETVTRTGDVCIGIWLAVLPPTR